MLIVRQTAGNVTVELTPTDVDVIEDALNDRATTSTPAAYQPEATELGKGFGEIIATWQHGPVHAITRQDAPDVQ